MGGNSGSGMIDQSSAGFQQLLNEGNQSWQTIFPLLQKLAPELMGTVNGQTTPLIQAARAPVIGQTQQDIRSIQNQAGGTGNPNALYQDIAMGGQQSAGLAGDQMLSTALQSLQGLITSGMQFTGSATSNASQGLGNLGTQEQEIYNQQQQAFWKALLGAAGGFAGGGGLGAAAAGAAGGYGGGGGGGALPFAPGSTETQIGGGGPTSMPFTAPTMPATAPVSGVPGFQAPGYSWAGVPSSMTQSGASTPASSSSSTSNIPGSGLPSWLNQYYSGG